MLPSPSTIRRIFLPPHLGTKSCLPIYGRESSDRPVSEGSRNILASRFGRRRMLIVHSTGVILSRNFFTRHGDHQADNKP